MITPDVAWELGFEEADAAFGADSVFGANPMNLESMELEAINTYIVGLPPKVEAMRAQHKLSVFKYNKFYKLFQDWKKYNSVVMGSWYVSDADLNLARKKRDDINMTIIPEATVQAQKYSAQAAGMTKTEMEKYSEESKTFLERNWLVILGLVGAGVTTAYLASSFFAYQKLALVKGLVH